MSAYQFFWGPYQVSRIGTNLHAWVHVRMLLWFGPCWECVNACARTGQPAAIWKTQLPGINFVYTLQSVVGYPDGSLSVVGQPWLPPKPRLPCPPLH